MKAQPVVITGRIKLRRFDPGYSGGRDKAGTKKRVEELGLKIAELQELLYANATRAILLLFQGMDASGKDGAIRTVLHYVNPAGVETANFKVPSAEERAHDYLWRIHKAIPRLGNIGVFNRSHYEAVLVERVQGITGGRECRRRYAEIIDFERMLVANGVVVLKFYLHLSRAEQAARLKERLTNPKKNWKFSVADLATRKLWRDYVDAYEDMLNATSHPAARWHVVPADHNWYRNYVVASTVARTLVKLRMKWPKPAENLSKIKIK
ncbi:MAG: Polyphosphate:nucleotide phosphotransferase, family [Lacunisphaera sp.]|nr:Polyphosphate:nucleotide phosphotransferase, family [Lacunisphaera sp.]MDB6165484.1 Polyphosphate:nucleotide phosphotransferase, family [Lacunisphaera sp.]